MEFIGRPQFSTPLLAESIRMAATMQDPMAEALASGIGALSQGVQGYFGGQQKGAAMGMEQQAQAKKSTADKESKVNEAQLSALIKSAESGTLRTADGQPVPMMTLLAALKDPSKAEGLVIGPRADANKPPVGYRVSATGNLEPIPGGPAIKPKGADKPLGSDVAIKTTLAQHAIRSLGDVERLLSGEDYRQLMTKAGGSFSKLKSMGDPKAEILVNAIEEAGDAEARFKSGAALKEAEEELYFKGLVRATGTKGGTSDKLARKKAFFETALKNLGAGRALPAQDEKNTAADRFAELLASGVSEEDAYKTLKTEGY